MVITLADPRKWNPQPSVEKGKKQRVYITESHKHRTWWWYLVGERIEQKSDLEVPEIMQAGEYFGKKKKGHIKEQISRSILLAIGVSSLALMEGFFFAPYIANIVTLPTFWSAVIRGVWDSGRLVPR